MKLLGTIITVGYRNGPRVFYRGKSRSIKFVLILILAYYKVL